MKLEKRVLSRYLRYEELAELEEAWRRLILPLITGLLRFS
jgi:hypothetical protein